MTGPSEARDSGGPPEALPERHRRILLTLVARYIDTGSPVASIRLAATSGVGLSSASIRNVLARLENEGYVQQPHTSAGRIPTDLGYRSYVNLLLRERRPGRPSARLADRLRRAVTVEDMMANVTQELSRASRHVGFALVPGTEDTRLQRIHFVPLDASRVLVIVVAAGGQVVHKVVDLGEPVRADELWQAANYLNTEFAGWRLPDVRATIADRLQHERRLYDALVARALRLARSSLEDAGPSDTLFVQGTSTLLGDAEHDDPSALDTLRTLFQMIEDKHRLIRLLTEYFEGPGLTVVIGAEHTAPDLRRFSLVAATQNDGTRNATIGVLGPTRMRYSQAITAVDSVSRAVSRAFGDASA